MAYQLKLDENGAATVQDDGRVIYIDDTDGKEVPVDVNQLYVKINNLNSESAQRRRRLNDLEQRYSGLEGIEDIGEFVTRAQDAFDKLEELEARSAGGGSADELEAAKKRLQESFEAKMSAVEKKLQGEISSRDELLKKKDGDIYRLMVASEFSKSEFFAGDKAQTFLSPEMAEKIWGDRFKVEEYNGSLRTVGYDAAGNQILSRENPGEPAGFKEAIGAIIDSDPAKAKYMRSAGGGTGSAGNGESGSMKSNDVGVLIARYSKAREMKNSDEMFAIKRQLAAIGHPNAVL